MTKIFWNASEKEQLARELNKLVDSGKFTTLLVAFQTIQQILPPGRRRELTTTSGVSCREIREIADKLRKAEVEAKDRVVAEVSAQPIIQPQPAKVEPSAEDQQIQGLEHLFRGMAQDMAAALEVFLVVEFEKVAERAFLAAAQSVKKRTSTLTKMAQQMAARPKILIVGLLPQQAHEIEAEFSDLINLSFVRTEENKDKLQNRLAGADEVIVMTKFISHSHSDIAKRHGNVVNINGGVTSLKDHLFHLVCN